MVGILLEILSLRKLSARGMLTLVNKRNCETTAQRGLTLFKIRSDPI